jgi:hypothetical protein
MKILSEKNKTDSVKEDHQQMEFYTHKFVLKAMEI